MENKTENRPITISKSPTSPDTWVDEHGDVLYTYAYLRVREHGLAEDLVQDTFLAALKSFQHYQGRSSVRTWLIGILKHKIIDFLRKNVKEQPVSVANFYDETLEKANSLDGSWLAGTAQWLSEPSKSLEQKEFMGLFQQSLAKLPPRLSQVFVLHELDGLKGSEICELMNITSSNLWVMLYRARTELKSQLSRLLQGKTEMKKGAASQKMSLTGQPLSYAPTKG